MFGLITGLLAYRMLKQVDNYSVEILISLALAAGGYALANALHLSGPIAMVVSGLLIGNHGRSFGIEPRSNTLLRPYHGRTRPAQTVEEVAASGRVRSVSRS